MLITSPYSVSQVEPNLNFRDLPFLLVIILQVFLESPILNLFYGELSMAHNLIIDNFMIFVFVKYIRLLIFYAILF